MHVNALKDHIAYLVNGVKKNPDDPVMYTAQLVLDNASDVKKGGWADPNINFTLRDSYAFGKRMKLDTFKCRGINPVMPTIGLLGRGLLGKWGPNFAADPLVVRFVEEGGVRKPQVLLIQRTDTDHWAIPGGMVEDGESFESTLVRELAEEAGVKLEPENVLKMVPLYRGYSDDTRNTDNAWIETTCVAFIMKDGLTYNEKADGLEAKHCKWVDLYEDIELFASHSMFIGYLREWLKEHHTI